MRGLQARWANTCESGNGIIGIDGTGGWKANGGSEASEYRAFWARREREEALFLLIHPTYLSLCELPFLVYDCSMVSYRLTGAARSFGSYLRVHSKETSDSSRASKGSETKSASSTT